MIKYLENSKIDRKKWDACIRHSQQKMVYGFSWYLDLTAPGWDALVKDDYLAVMPLPVRKKYGFVYLYQPLLTQQLGIYSKMTLTYRLSQEFISQIPAHIKYIDYNLNYMNNKGLEGYTLTEKQNYELKLNSDYATIEKGFTDNTRRNIRKSIMANGIDFNVNVQDLVDLKRKEQTGIRGAEFYQWLNIYMTKLLNTGKGHIIGIRSKNELIAAAFFYICLNRIYYLIPVSNEAGKKKRAMFAILDHIIGKYADTGLILDFEGSTIPGIARFFAGFGAKSKPYVNLQKNMLPFPVNLIKK